MGAAHKPFIIYVDDDPDDLLFFEEATTAGNPLAIIKLYNNGKAAFNYLESIPNGNLLPSVIVLDLNMVGWNGIETLKAIRQDKSYQGIPVFIFTNSEHPQHRQMALDNGAVDFVKKPYTQEGLLEVCARFSAYTQQPAAVKNV